MVESGKSIPVFLYPSDTVAKLKSKILETEKIHVEKHLMKVESYYYADDIYQEQRLVFSLVLSTQALD